MMPIQDFQTSGIIQDPGEWVGTLYRWDPESGKVTNPFYIHSHESLYLGRDTRHCKYVIHDPTVSNRHLRIYTVVYDRENPSDVAPLVYAQDLSRNGTWWNGHQMSKANGGVVLLSHGDTLQVCSGFILEFRCRTSQEAESFTGLQREEMKAFAAKYLITNRKLGEGAFGQVHMTIDVANGRQLACKVVDVRAIQERLGGRTVNAVMGFSNSGCPENLSRVKSHELIATKRGLEFYDREVDILARLCHPNIISLERVIRTEATLYIFQELVTAGDLFAFIEYRGGIIPDIEAAFIVRQILMAIQYLHDKNIVHRDVKPENVLMTSLDYGGRVVLADFGCAQVIEWRHKRLSTIVGTLEYAAPEIMHQTSQRGYTKSIDLWSLGCIAVTLLIGCPPFPLPPSGAFDDRAVKPGDMRHMLGNPRWHRVGPFAQNFVYNLLTLDETDRMTTTEALQHIWLTNCTVRQKLEEMYAKAVRSWKPCVTQGPIILDLTTVDDVTAMIDADHDCDEKVQDSIIQEGSFPLTDHSGESRSPDGLLVSAGVGRGSTSSPKEHSTAGNGELKDLTQGREASPSLSDPDFPMYSPDEKVNVATAEDIERDEKKKHYRHGKVTSVHVGNYHLPSQPPRHPFSPQTRTVARTEQ